MVDNFLVPGNDLRPALAQRIHQMTNRAFFLRGSPVSTISLLPRQSAAASDALPFRRYRGTTPGHFLRVMTTVTDNFATRTIG